MTWDLGKAMRKKEEFESARLMDFEFRQRARATRLLAQSLGMDEGKVVSAVAVYDEARMLRWLAERSGASEAAVAAEYGRCLAIARKDLIVERGDPTPYRLG